MGICEPSTARLKLPSRDSLVRVWAEHCLGCIIVHPPSITSCAPTVCSIVNVRARGGTLD